MAAMVVAGSAPRGFRARGFAAGQFRIVRNGVQIRFDERIRMIR